MKTHKGKESTWQGARGRQSEKENGKHHRDSQRRFCKRGEGSGERKKIGKPGEAGRKGRSQEPRYLENSSNDIAILKKSEEEKVAKGCRLHLGTFKEPGSMAKKTKEQRENCFGAQGQTDTKRQVGKRQKYQPTQRRKRGDTAKPR